jgi:Domain of unknown function (DUF4177)
MEWEYLAKTVEIYPTIELRQQLNKYGCDGWELVSVTTGPDQNGRVWPVAIFKRPVAEASTG